MPTSRQPGFVFPGDGVMTELHRMNGWSSTPLGPPEGWPATLQAAVSLVLECRFPMMIGWGPDLLLLYNDGYIPFLGEKHPVIGLPGREVWKDAWTAVGPLLEGVIGEGTSVFRANEWIPLVRSGFLEDCWFTLSYSPLRDPSGAVVGLLSTAVETTREVVAANREAVLLSVVTPREGTPQGLARALAPLDGFRRDVPFHLALVPHPGGGFQVAASGGCTGPDRVLSVEELRAWGWLPVGLGAGTPIRVRVGALSGLVPEPGHAAHVGAPTRACAS